VIWRPKDGLFLAALATATILPMQSKATLVGLLLIGGHSSVLLVTVASIDNALGDPVTVVAGVMTEPLPCRDPVQAGKADANGTAIGCGPNPTESYFTILTELATLSPCFVANLIATFVPDLKSSASDPSARVKTLPSVSVIESCDESTLFTTPVVLAANAEVETMASAATDVSIRAFFMIFSLLFPEFSRVMERSDSKLSAKCFLIYIKDNIVLIRYSAWITASAMQNDHFETCRARPGFNLQGNTVTKQPDRWLVAFEITLVREVGFHLTKP
jgi:hypothetical protein